MRTLFRSTRVMLAFLFAFGLIQTPTLAASQLSAVNVLAGREGGPTRIVLTIPGGAPAGWHFTGAGTTQVTVILPGTSVAPNLGQLDYRGSNNVSNVSVNSLASEVDVTIHLTEAALVNSSAAGNYLTLDVAPPKTPTTSIRKPEAAGELSSQASVIIPLRYADVSEIAGILVDGAQIPPNDTFSPQGSIFSLPSSTVVAGAPATSSSIFSTNLSQPLSVGQRLDANVAIDRRLNAVVITGTPAQIAYYKDLISRLDVPLSSVMLECEVVELDEAAARYLGIDYTANGVGTAVGSASAAIGTRTNASGTVGSGPPSFGASFQAQLYATIEHGNGRILDTPRILAVNGTPAQILTGEALPIISTTTTLGSTAYQQSSVNYIAVGVNLQIEPRISDDGFVTSHVFAEVSSVGQYVSGGVGQPPIPQVELRQVTTMATVADGVPFVIGGLLKDEEIESLSKLPGIGDLPIIGSLFRNESKTVTKQNLFIIITPHIVARTGSNLEVPYNSLPQPSVPGPVPHATATP